jgi:hypothetical protein
MIFKAYPDFHVTVLQAIVDGRSAVDRQLGIPPS